jgi:uncharacterized protein
MRVSRMLWAIAAGALFASLLSAYAFALDVPSLTGRVVDQADGMTAESRSDVEAKSKDLEDKSGIQLVVATVKSLQGGDIETYANELFRSWKLGQAQKNNGVLLFVAPAEHKVRIEVGYGLEGTLTDAISSVIISSAIIPHFKNGDFPGGIEGGVNGSVLNGDPASWQPVVGTREHISSGQYVIIFFVFSVLIGVVILAIKGIIHPKPRGHYVKRDNRMVFVPARHSSGDSSSWSSSDSSDSSSSSDDFSGGGGSSGGGGASGSW